MSALLNRLNTAATARWGSSATMYLGLLLALFFVYLACIPIQYHDTDMWYHLAGGRYFLANLETYNPYVASYLAPERPFINYFWGFQVSAYSIWTVAGEPGLIIYKALLLLATAFLATRILLLDQPFRSANALQLIAITLVVALLCTKSVSLRPHLGSFLFIALFTYILMFKEKWYPALPLLAVAWVNFHGVEYIIGVLICGAFFLERVYNWWQAGTRDPAELRTLIWLLLCAPAVLVNPNGYNLLLTPFVQDANIWMFISELQPFRPDLALDFSSGLTMGTTFWLLVLLTVFGLARILQQDEWPLAPLVLAAGGAILLLTASRFTLEWILLTTPLLGIGLRRESASNHFGWIIGLAALLSALVAAYWPSTAKNLYYYPLNQHSLPSGTTEFIRRANISGRYAVAPSHAGYIEFAEIPGIRIHMDMHFPPFTSDTFHELLAAMITAPGLRHYISKYSPDLIGVDRNNEYFAANLVNELGYVPVFFDRRIALYLNEEKHPAIAREYRLAAINPMDEKSIRADQLELAITELEKMLEAADTPIARETLAGLLLETGNLPRAASHIELLGHVQADPVTYRYLKARLAHLDNRCEDAVTDYETAIRHSDSAARMHRLAAECYFLLKQPQDAYEHFSAALNPYQDSQPDARTYYLFALAAIGSGHDHEAIQLLRMIERVDADGSYRDKARELLDSLASEPL